MAANISELRKQSSTQVVKKNDFPSMLEKFKGEIARALPKHLNADRVARIALTAFRQTPKLAECDPRSVFAAVIQSSQLGLEVGLMGEAHLVPFNKNAKVGNQWVKTVECTLIPGYQGLMKLARNTGVIADIYAHAVRAHDTFDIVLGLDQTLKHEPLKDGGFPASDEDRGPIVGFYAVAVFKDGTKHFEAMSLKQVEAIRDKSSGYKAAAESAKKYGKEADSPWISNFEAMGIKTVIRRLCKYLPKSPELAQALALDDRAEDGKAQGIEINDAIEGTWTPSADEPEEQAPEQDKPVAETPPERHRAQQAEPTTDRKTGEIAPPETERPPIEAYADEHNGYGSAQQAEFFAEVPQEETRPASTGRTRGPRNLD